MDQKKSKLSRRNFLLGVGAGSAAGAAALVVRRGQVTGSGDEKASDGSRGYQSTAHVNNYYRTAKV